MAAAKKGTSQGRPGRPLAVILLAIVALVAGMFISGHTKPRLGIDLAGGTSITLTAKAEPGQGGAINATNMKTAVNIIDRRVNGLGVSDAQVQSQGSKNIVVNIPKGTNEEQAKAQVGTTARLYFRPVLSEVAGTPSTEPSASSSGSSSSSGSPSSSASPSTSASSTASGSASSTATNAGNAAAKNANPGDVVPAADTSTSPAATPAPSASGLDTSIPADLTKELDKLDCSKAANRTGREGKPAEKVVACGQDGQAKYALGPVAVDGTDLKDAKASLDTQQGLGWQVNLEFDSKGAKKFSNITGELAKQASPNNQFAIVLDGQVVSAPSVNEAIGGGRAQITGSFSQQEADDLANILSYGALPLSFVTSDVTTVSPQLGHDQLTGGLIAGGVGLLLVVLYCLAYYRGLAFVSVLSLVVSAVLTYTVMSLLGPTIGFALNLPAVCGAIVAIGITADSYIVYFERIRDEIREGRSLRPAVERAWPRARRTIVVSDFVSFLAAAVLFIVSIGQVQGFAFTLGLTTVLDVVVVFLFTKPLISMLSRGGFFASGSPWSGLDPARLGAKEAPIHGRRRRGTAGSEVREA